MCIRDRVNAIGYNRMQEIILKIIITELSSCESLYCFRVYKSKNAARTDTCKTFFLFILLLHACSQSSSDTVLRSGRFTKLNP